MMSQTSAEMNVNINPPGYMEICINHVTEKGKKLLNGWERWSLEDVNRTLDVLKEPGHRSAAQYVGQIIFNVLLKAANDPKIPFEAIEKTVFKTLNARVALLDKNPFEDFVVTGEDRGKVCNFLKAFVKHGEDDSRYYGLVYKMLTHQSRKNKTFPLGFQMAECEGFDEVLNKLPQKMQTQLWQESFYYDDDEWDSDGRTCYSLLEGRSVGM